MHLGLETNSSCLLCWFPALPIEYNTLSSAGMVYLEILNANMGSTRYLSVEA